MASMVARFTGTAEAVIVSARWPFLSMRFTPFRFKHDNVAVHLRSGVFEPFASMASSLRMPSYTRLPTNMNSAPFRPMCTQADVRRPSASDTSSTPAVGPLWLKVRIGDGGIVQFKQDTREFDVVDLWHALYKDPAFHVEMSDLSVGTCSIWVLGPTKSRYKEEAGDAKKLEGLATIGMLAADRTEVIGVDTYATIHIVPKPKPRRYPVNDVGQAEVDLADAIRKHARVPFTPDPFFVNRDVETFELLTCYFDNMERMHPRMTARVYKPTVMVATQYTGIGKTSLGMHIPFALQRKLDETEQRKLVANLEVALDSRGDPILSKDRAKLLHSLVQKKPQSLLRAYFIEAYNSALDDNARVIVDSLTISSPLLVEFVDSDLQLAPSPYNAFCLAVGRRYLRDYPNSDALRRAYVGRVFSELSADVFPYVFVLDGMQRIRETGDPNTVETRERQLLATMRVAAHGTRMLLYGASRSFPFQSIVLDWGVRRVHLLNIRPWSAADIRMYLGRRCGRSDILHDRLSRGIRDLTGGHARSVKTVVDHIVTRHPTTYEAAMEVATAVLKDLAAGEAGENGVGLAVPQWKDCFRNIKEGETSKLLEKLLLLLAPAVLYRSPLDPSASLGKFTSISGRYYELDMETVLRRLPIPYEYCERDEILISMPLWQQEMLQREAVKLLKVTPSSVKMKLSNLFSGKDTLKEAFALALNERATFHLLAAGSACDSFEAKLIFPFVAALNDGKWASCRCPRITPVERPPAAERGRMFRGVHGGVTDAATPTVPQLQFMPLDPGYVDAVTSQPGTLSIFGRESPSSAVSLPLGVGAGASAPILYFALDSRLGFYAKDLLILDRVKAEISMLPFTNDGDIATLQDAVLVLYWTRWNTIFLNLSVSAKWHRAAKVKATALPSVEAESLVFAPGTYVYNSKRIVSTLTVVYDEDSRTVTFSPSHSPKDIAPTANSFTVPERCTVVCVVPKKGSRTWHAVFGPDIDKYMKT